MFHSSVNTKSCGADKLDAEIEYEGGDTSRDVKISSSGDIQYLTFVPVEEGTARVKITLHGEHVRGKKDVTLHVY